MSIEIILDGVRVVALSGAVKYVVREMDAGKMDIDQAKGYLRQQGILPETAAHLERGEIDFDDLTDGKPTVHGDFYAKNSEPGLRLTGRWEAFNRELAETHA